VQSAPKGRSRGSSEGPADGERERERERERNKPGLDYPLLIEEVPRIPRSSAFV